MEVMFCFTLELGKFSFHVAMRTLEGQKLEFQEKLRSFVETKFIESSDEETGLNAEDLIIVMP